MNTFAAIIDQREAPFSGAPVLGHAFEKHTQNPVDDRANPASSAHDSDTDNEFDSYDLTPGGETLTQKVKNLLAQGYIFSAVELLQTALMDAPAENIQNVLGLAGETLSYLQDCYRHETSLITGLESFVLAYEQVLFELNALGVNLSDLANSMAMAQLTTNIQNERDGLGALFAMLMGSEMDKLEDLESNMTEDPDISNDDPGFVANLAALKSLKEWMEERQRKMERAAPNLLNPWEERRRKMSLAPAPSFTGLAA